MTQDTASKITTKWEHSMQGWEMAVETADTPERRRAARHDADAAESCWDEAIAATERGDFAAAVEHLRGAARLASDWGDDSEERAAIAAVEAARAVPSPAPLGDRAAMREWIRLSDRVYSAQR